jgi:hypothetical protein
MRTSHYRQHSRVPAAEASGILCRSRTTREALSRRRRRFGSLAAEYTAVDIERAAGVRIEAAAE